MSGIRDDTQLRLRPCRVQRPGIIERTDHIVTPMDDDTGYPLQSPGVRQDLVRTQKGIMLEIMCLDTRQTQGGERVAEMIDHRIIQAQSSGTSLPQRPSLRRCHPLHLIVASQASIIRREQVAALHAELVRYGLVVWTAGNVSARVPGHDLLVIKPSGVSYDELTPESMIVCDLDGTRVDGEYSPSSDTATHAYVYRNMPQVGGVVHTHSPYATAYAAARRPIGCWIEALAMFGLAATVAYFAGTARRWTWFLPAGVGAALAGDGVAVAFAAVAEQALELRRVLRRGDDQDVANAGQHQDAERIIDHRLVVDRQQLLRDRDGDRMQARTRAAGEDDALHERDANGRAVQGFQR